MTKSWESNTLFLVIYQLRGTKEEEEKKEII